MPSWRERDAEAFGRNALPKITAVAAMISPSVLDIDRLSTQRREHPPETVLDRDLWLPPEHLAGPGDVGLPEGGDARVDALLALVRHRHRLGVPLCLVVDAAGANRVDIAPVRLRLRVDLGVAVDLARRGEEEARPLELRQPEHVVRAVGADLEGVQREPLVVDRAGRARQVVDDVDGLGDLQVVDEVVVAEDEAVVANVLDVLERSRVEVVDTDDTIALGEEVLA